MNVTLILFQIDTTLEESALSPAPPENVGREQAKGCWQPGRSGNPRGKPKGARNHATRAAEALLEGEANALTRKAIDSALAGDVMALRLCMERILPARKSRLVNFELPAVKSATDLPAALAALIEAIAQGNLSPDEATPIAALLDAQRRAIETTELEKRIAALEAGRALS
ncbi:DUF5681 domain-containing protein [Reyranella soli]|uniref:DUF5681 domain-containing protein n=1 Tax=Reyranella soli TaxID=1230389 RepID=A0A512NL26_9HYPH|nr:DUF5681 domain-containing protein [Reyranella soli]GEP59645.1 hypothetical protein RSO01_68110 [Reyranella soli]